MSHIPPCHRTYQILELTKSEQTTRRIHLWPNLEESERADDLFHMDAPINTLVTWGSSMGSGVGRGASSPIAIARAIVKRLFVSSRTESLVNEPL